MKMAKEQTITVGFKVVKGDHSPDITGVFCIYEHQFSRFPDMIRVMFKDGSTAVYDIHAEHPHPLVLENIEIMRTTKKKIQGYVNKPERRWRKK